MTIISFPNKISYWVFGCVILSKYKMEKIKDKKAFGKTLMKYEVVETVYRKLH